MEVRAIAKYVRVQPRKVRIIADEVRGLPADRTSHLLRFHRSKSAQALRKVLESAIANAAENHNVPRENLRIARITVDEGPRIKRIQARAMGRANRIIKKTSHITVWVQDYEGEQQVKPHGTKAKPRPTFAAPAGKKGGAKKKAEKPAEEVVEKTGAEEAIVEAGPVEAAVAAAETVETAETAQEATPVTEADAPEEAGSAEPVAEQEETTEKAEGATGEAEDGEKKGAE